MDSQWSVPSCFCGFLRLVWDALGISRSPETFLPKTSRISEWQDPTIPSWYVMICPSSFHLVSIYFLYMFYINVPWLLSFPIPHRIVSPGWLLPPWSQPCLCCTNSCGPSRDPSVAAAIRISRAPWIRDLEVVSGGRGLCREPTGQLIQIYIYTYIYIIYNIYIYIYIIYIYIHIYICISKYGEVIFEYIWYG